MISLSFISGTAFTAIPYALHSSFFWGITMTSDSFMILTALRVRSSGSPGPTPMAYKIPLIVSTPLSATNLRYGQTVMAPVR